MSNKERNGEYAPTGEQGGTGATFSADEIASAFDVDADRVREAISGEFGFTAGPIDSRQAQQVAEILLSNLPQGDRIAALVRLGAYTPRPDHVEGLGEKDPEEESDKLRDSVDDRDDV